MAKFHLDKIGLALAGLLAALLGAAWIGSPLPRLAAALQSPLSSPLANPQWIAAAKGGTARCAGITSSAYPAWLEVPARFTSKSGAEFRCDANPELDAVRQLNKSLFSQAVLTRGVLIGVYPAVSLAKPLQIVFQLTDREISKSCKNCIQGRYFDARKKQWINLPTQVDLASRRVQVRVSSYPPRSAYPAYADRFLVALFRR